MSVKVSFVVPCYNSEKTIKGVVEEILQLQQELLELNIEIILVNDCSVDNTYAVISKLAKENDNIVSVNLSKNFGQHAALMAGFAYTTGDYVCCLDDDGQTPAEEFHKLYEELIAEQLDVVYAKYIHKEHSAFRNFGSWMNQKMTEYFLDKPKDLYLSSYFLAKRYVIDNILVYKNPYPYMMGLVLQSTKKIGNVEVNHKPRKVSQSGYSVKKLISLWVNGITAFSVKPLRVSSFLGFMLTGISIIGLLYLFINKIVNPTVPLGWSSVILSILLVGGLLAFILGLIGEYVGRIYLCINNIPQYVIKDDVDYRSLNAKK